MVTGTELRNAWECGTCGVVSRNPRVGAAPMPAGWDRDDEDRPRCLACSRAGNGLDPSDRRARRQRASAAAQKRKRLEREQAIADALLALGPAEGSEAVAEAMEASGAGRAKVEEVRRTLRASGELPPAARPKAAGRPRPAGASEGHGGKTRRVEEALRRDHRRTNAAVAEEVGVAGSTVDAARRRLGLRWDTKAAERDATHSILARLGETNHGAVARELGVEPETARQRLNVLAREGRAAKRRDGRCVVYRSA
jgi:hypothetical protein